MVSKVTLLYSNAFYDVTYNTNYKYWHVIDYLDSNKIMPNDCYDDGDTFPINITCTSSDFYRGKFSDMDEYVDKFAYISEPVIDELVKIIKESKNEYFIFVFLNHFEFGINIITIRLLNKFYHGITVVIEISDIEHSLKTKRVKLFYDKYQLM